MEQRVRRDKKCEVNKRYPSQFLSSCWGGTAVQVAMHKHANTHRQRKRESQRLLMMSDTDTAMQRDRRGEGG